MQYLQYHSGFYVLVQKNYKKYNFDFKIHSTEMIKNLGRKKNSI